jgi:hypothetical protein
MRLFISGATATIRRHLDRDRLGLLLVPDAGNSPQVALSLGLPWAADNAAFSGFRPKAFCGLLARVSGHPDCRFVACPDVVGNAVETLRLFQTWAPILRALGLPVALVGQDGLEQLDIPWQQMDALFIGGSTDWKLSPGAASIIREAKRRSLWVHLGRVNTRLRFRYAHQLGCDSVDGSGFSRWPEQRIPLAIRWMTERLAALTSDRDTAGQQASAEITIGGRSTSRADAAGILAARLEALPETVRETRRIPLGVYRGLRFGMVLHPDFSPEMYLEGATIRQVSLSREHQGARAVLNALERLVGGYGAACDSVRQDLAIAEGQLRDYRTRLGAPFSHDSYLTELSNLRDQLKTGLSGGAVEPGADPVAEVPVLAERIKVLRAGHTVEPTPDRTQKRPAEAEEPVTARIRRRTMVVQAAGPGREPDETASQTETAPAPRDAGNRAPGDAGMSQKPERPGWHR